MQRSFIVLLFLGCVRALLQNVTVDDASSDIIYDGPTFHCNATAPCIDDEAEAEGLFNESATLTFGSITFNFTGVAFYASLDIIGAAAIRMDGETFDVVKSNLSEAQAGRGSHNTSKANMANVLHTLEILPDDTTLTIIGLDQLIYTASLPDKKSHVGAIVGGVIGGVALIFGVLFALMFSRRRKLILRRNQRKSAVLRGITAANVRQDYPNRAGEEDAKELPA
ncbi:hypothetical protein B0H19DRAFT_1192573 [Mycena capillaripes]|nr:hypothetical protein B0H19DRAFT_1192573 [Mycena capillaripes]